jgi:hypothetical protein
MTTDIKLNLTKNQLIDLLNQAFDEGMCGYQDLKEDFIEKLIEPVITNAAIDAEIDALKYSVTGVGHTWNFPPVPSMPSSIQFAPIVPSVITISNNIPSSIVITPPVDITVEMDNLDIDVSAYDSTWQLHRPATPPMPTLDQWQISSSIIT